MELKEIQEMCESLCAKAGVELTVPVKLNGRLTATLGRVQYYNYDKIKPCVIEFSKRYFEEASRIDCEDVIIHECAHYVITVRTGQRHGHDSVFKATCIELGGTLATGKTHHDSLNIETDLALEKRYKYIVYCKSCGKKVGQYQRMAGNLKHLDQCTCGLCGGSLYYVER